MGPARRRDPDRCDHRRVAGTGQPAAGNVLLSNPIATYIGDISYSLYLWHFPIIILFGEYKNDHDAVYYAGSLAMMAVFSVASYHGIEKPVQTSPFLTRFGNDDLKRGAWRKWRDDVRVPVTAGLTALAVAVTGVLVSGAVQASSATSVGDDEPVVAITKASGPSTPKAVRAVQAKLVSALNATTWPQLDPSIDSLPDAGLPVEFSKAAGCQSATASNCSFGSGSKTIAVYGDSLAVALLPVVREAFGSEYRIKGLTQVGCPITELKVKFPSEGRKNACLKERELGLSWIKEHQPDVVLVMQNYDSTDILTNRKHPVAQWKKGDETLVAKLKGSTKNLVFVAPRVGLQQLVDCAGPNSTPADCVGKPSDTFTAVHDYEASSALPSPAKFIDESKLFCVDWRCPAFSGTTPVLADGSHTTRQYAKIIAPAFKALAARAGIH